MVFGLDAAAVAAIVSAAAAVGTGTVAAVEADRGANRARKGARVQDKAQKDAAADAAAKLRQNQEAERAGARKEPNVGDLLTTEQADRLRGPQSTLLTGQGTAQAKLGRTSLLGS